MIYFDNGATTFPKPKSVINAVNKAMTLYSANPGRSGYSMAIKSSEIIYECRENVAKLFDFDKPENVVFTNNCTTALNTVIKGILKKGDHAVISSFEHNSVLRPLEHLKKYGVEYSVANVVVGDDEQTIENFRKSFKSNTKLVICTHASNVFGVKLPIERISALCKIYDILFCLDAAQTAGVVPISLKNSYINFLCTAGHKGLYGPMGTGVLVINSETLPESLVQGGTGSVSLEKQQPDDLPDKYESGTLNLVGIAGLLEGVKYVMNKTPEKIYEYEMLLVTYMYDVLSKNKNVILYTDRPQNNKCVPLLSFNVKNLECEQTGKILNDKFKIAVRSGYHCSPLAHKTMGTYETGTVRAVVSSFNTMQEIKYFLNSIVLIK